MIQGRPSHPAATIVSSTKRYLMVAELRLPASLYVRLRLVRSIDMSFILGCAQTLDPANNRCLHVRPLGHIPSSSALSGKQLIESSSIP